MARPVGAAGLAGINPAHNDPSLDPCWRSFGPLANGTQASSLSPTRISRSRSWNCCPRGRHPTLLWHTVNEIVPQQAIRLKQGANCPVYARPEDLPTGCRRGICTLNHFDARWLAARGPFLVCLGSWTDLRRDPPRPIPDTPAYLCVVVSIAERAVIFPFSLLRFPHSSSEKAHPAMRTVGRDGEGTLAITSLGSRQLKCSDEAERGRISSRT